MFHILDSPSLSLSLPLSPYIPSPLPTKERGGAWKYKGKGYEKRKARMVPMAGTYLFSSVELANDVLNQCIIKRMSSFTLATDALTKSTWYGKRAKAHSWAMSLSLQRYSLR